MSLTEKLLLVGGLLHLATLCAAFAVPYVLDWKTELAKLATMLRQLFWVYGAFIAYTILAFGVLTLACATQLADGSPLARAVCGLIATFWAARVGVQFFLFDPKPYLTHWIFAAGYHGLTLIFISQTFIYGYAALAGWAF